MFGMGMGELILILVVALLVLGPEKIPDAAKAIGKGMRELRRHTRDLQQTLEQDETIGGTVKELKSVLRGEDLPTVRPPPSSSPRPAVNAEQAAAAGLPTPPAPAPTEQTAPAPAPAAPKKDPGSVDG